MPGWPAVATQVANIEQANHPKADRTVRDGSGFDTNV
jgi:hypothetical protein